MYICTCFYKNSLHQQFIELQSGQVHFYKALSSIAKVAKWAQVAVSNKHEFWLRKEEGKGIFNYLSHGKGFPFGIKGISHATMFKGLRVLMMLESTAGLRVLRVPKRR